MRAKGNVHKSCLVKPPRCAPPSSSASSATEPTAALDRTVKASRRASATTPPVAQTVSRCLSLVQFLTVLCAQGHVQAEQDDAAVPSDEVKQEEEETREVEVAAVPAEAETVAPVAVPVAGLLQLGFGRVGAPSTGTVTSSENTRPGRTLQHKFASLTISDAEAIKTSSTSAVAEPASLAESLGAVLSSAASTITALCTGQQQLTPSVESPAAALASPGSNPRYCSLTADSYDCVTLGDSHPAVLVSPPLSTPQSRSSSARQLSPTGSDHEEYVVIPSPPAPIPAATVPQ